MLVTAYVNKADKSMKENKLKVNIVLLLRNLIVIICVGLFCCSLK